MRREDFESLLERLLVSVVDGGSPPSIKAFQKTAELRDAVLSAWDAQAAEVERLRVEVEALRVGVPLTEENADRARVVEVVERRAGRERHELFTRNTEWAGPAFWSTYDVEGCDAAELIARGATVLAWRKP